MGIVARKETDNEMEDRDQTERTVTPRRDKESRDGAEPKETRKHDQGKDPRKEKQRKARERESAVLCRAPGESGIERERKMGGPPFVLSWGRY